MTQAKEESPELVKRLINWNVEVLLKLLKQVVAKREASGTGGWDDDPILVLKDTAAEEVVDVISLPAFDENAVRHEKSIDVAPQVEQQLREYVTAIAQAFRSYPFHCLQHASQSTVTATKLISRITFSDFENSRDNHDDSQMISILEHIHSETCGLSSDPLAEFTVALAALVCNVDHRGIDNEALGNEEPELSKKFNGTGLTEELSIEKAWKKLMSPDFENLRRCLYSNEEEKQRFRQIFVNAIMATDSDNEEAQAKRQERWDSSFGPRADAGDGPNGKAASMIECLVQASVNFFTMQDWHVYIRWNERAFEEASRAYKEERVSVDPAKTWYRDVLKKFDNFIIPLTMQMKDIEAFVSSDEYLNYALQNRQRWASNGREIVSAFVAKHITGSATAKVDLIKAISKEGKDDESTAKVATAGKHSQRLVDWNNEVLARLLKQILAKRKLSGNEGNVANFVLKTEGGTAVDEVVEVIKFPQFEASSSADKLGASIVELSAPVAMQLKEYVGHVCSQYGNNLYHGLDHASYVSMTVKKLMDRLILGVSGASAESAHNQTFGLVSDPLAQFAVVFAALIHDMAHEGVGNQQLVEEGDDLAKRYQNRAVTEQHSIELAWNQLMQPEFEDLRCAICANEQEMRRFRQLVVKAVIATDHADKQLVARRRMRWEKAFGSEGDNMDLKATIVVVLLLQAADSFHAIQHWDVYRKWSERKFSEAYEAFESGRVAKNPSLDWYQNELSLLDEHIIPLCKSMKQLGAFGKSADESLALVATNRAKLIAGKETIVKVMLDKYLGKEKEKARAEMIAHRASLSAV